MTSILKIDNDLANSTITIWFNSNTLYKATFQCLYDIVDLEMYNREKWRARTISLNCWSAFVQSKNPEEFWKENILNDKNVSCYLRDENFEIGVNNFFS